MQQTDYALVPTGFVRELYDLVVELDYPQFAQGEHPIHDDAYLYAEEMQRSHRYFREFLERMVRRGGSLADVAELMVP